MKKSSMWPNQPGSVADQTNAALVRVLKARYEAADQVRRGVCLLNAGQFQMAEAAFRRAVESGCADQSLPALLAASLVAQDRITAATEQFVEAVRQDDAQTPARIRHALWLWSTGDSDGAIDALREGVRLDPENAELHFQLGTLLTSRDEYEEAELRFLQAINIDRDHVEAAVSLALCCGVRRAPEEALVHLQRAQARRPLDARIGLLLSQAAAAVDRQGQLARVLAEMPSETDLFEERGIEELSRVIEGEPDFVDAFLSISIGDVDEQVYAMLLRTIEAALSRQPEHAELHYHCGRVLERLGRSEEAIQENERAVQLDPNLTKALIELSRLYHRTDRDTDARTRLEQAIAAGAEYADVYFLLGNLYRSEGKISRAASAYRKAIGLNEGYEAAIEALDALPV